MANQVLKRFPRGQLDCNGQLAQVTDAEFSVNNNAKLIHTLRRGGKPAGVVKGNEEVAFNFTAAIDEDGREKDWVKICQKMEGKNFQFKSPVDTDVVEGVLQSVTVTMAGGEAVILKATGIGTFPD